MNFWQKINHLFFGKAQAKTLLKNFNLSPKETIEQLVKWIINGGDISIADNYGNTLLHYSGRLSTSITPYLKKYGVDVKEDISLTDYLISKGANANKKNQSGECPLYWQINAGIRHISPQLIHATSIANLNNISLDPDMPELKLTILTYYIATYKPDLKTLDTLCKAGADVNLPDAYGKTPIQYLLFDRNFTYAEKEEYIKVLINNGATIKDKKGLKFAQEVLEGSIKAEKFDLLNLLIDLNIIDLSLSDSHGNTLLHAYAKSLALSNDVTTPAQAQKERKLVETLLKYIDINAVNEYGQTPLNVAVSGNFYIPNTFNKNHQAHILIEAGADLNIPDNNGNTPLHNAAAAGNEEIVHALLSYGADASRLNNRQRKPEEMAQSNVRYLFMQPEIDKLTTANNILKNKAEEKQDIISTFNTLPKEKQVQVAAHLVQHYPDLFYAYNHDQKQLKKE